MSYHYSPHKDVATLPAPRAPASTTAPLLPVERPRGFAVRDVHDLYFYHLAFTRCSSCSSHRTAGVNENLYLLGRAQRVSYIAGRARARGHLCIRALKHGTCSKANSVSTRPMAPYELAPVRGGCRREHPDGVVQSKHRHATCVVHRHTRSVRSGGIDIAVDAVWRLLALATGSTG
jgi:hypothetical protein